MATAPRPSEVGYEEEARQVDDAKRVMTVTVRGAVRSNGEPIRETHQFTPMNLPFSEELVFRKETSGMTLESFVAGETSFNLTSMSLLWWMARRANGETFLTRKRAFEEFPSNPTEADLELSIEGDDDEVVEEASPES